MMMKTIIMLVIIEMHVVSELYLEKKGNFPFEEKEAIFFAA